MRKDAVRTGGTWHDSNGQKVQMKLHNAVKQWPTPRAEDSECAGAHRGIPDTLSSATRLWPTPRADKTTSENPEVWEKRQADGKVSSPPLGAAVRMYPTPKRATSGPDYARAGREGSGGDDLVTAIARMYPTPTTQDAENNCGPSQLQRRTPPLNAVVGGQLNPAWVEWLMGWPQGWSAPEPVSPEVCAAALSGHFWDCDPADLPEGHPAYVPRLTETETPARRRARLQALGNGWVPQAAAIVVLAMREALAAAWAP